MEIKLYSFPVFIRLFQSSSPITSHVHIHTHTRICICLSLGVYTHAFTHTYILTQPCFPFYLISLSFSDISLPSLIHVPPAPQINLYGQRSLQPPIFSCKHFKYSKFFFKNLKWIYYFTNNVLKWLTEYPIFIGASFILSSNFFSGHEFLILLFFFW